jgi:hypothetical protein
MRCAYPPYDIYRQSLIPSNAVIGTGKQIVGLKPDLQIRPSLQ